MEFTYIYVRTGKQLQNLFCVYVDILIRSCYIKNIPQKIRSHPWRIHGSDVRLAEVAFAKGKHITYLAK